MKMTLVQLLLANKPNITYPYRHAHTSPIELWTSNQLVWYTLLSPAVVKSYLGTILQTTWYSKPLKIWTWFILLHVVMVTRWFNVIHLPISLRVTSLALWLSYDCSSVSEVTLNDMGKTDWYKTTTKRIIRADSRLAPSQRETLLQSNAISHWLGTNLESTLFYYSSTSETILNDMVKLSCAKPQ